MQSPQARPQRRWSNRDVVREIDRHRAMWLWGILLGLVVAAAPTAAHLYSKNLCLELGYEINALERERRELLEQRRRLAEHRASLESPGAIEAWGVDQRGMLHPRPEQVIVVQRAMPNQKDLLAFGTRRAHD